jgi:DNA helicase IV
MRQNEIGFSTIYSFKGLESKIICLLDVSSFADQKNRLLNYVAISRASAGLYVFYNKSAEEERQKNLIEGFKKLK